MAETIVNAAPTTVQRGTQDLSTQVVPREPLVFPQHLPKFLLFTQDGPTTPQLVSGNEMVRMYGAASFDPLSLYYNHATVFATLANAQGNALMIERVIPADAGPEANLTLWLDVQATTITQYQRNADGTFFLDAGGNKVPLAGPGLAGYKVKWVVDYENSVTNLATNWGTLVSKAGTIGVGPTLSTMYPILQLKGAFRGANGNNKGLRLWAPTTATVGIMPSKLLSQTRVYPFYVQMVARPDATSTPKVVENLLGDQFITVSLKPGAVDPVTTQQLYLEDVLLDSYQNLTDLKYPAVYGNFGALHVYQNNIDTLLSLFLAAEVAGTLESWHDFVAANGDNDKYLFNPVSGVSSGNVPYKTYQILSAVDPDGTDAIMLSDLTNIYAKGGSDGTMSNANFATLVSARMAAYADPNDEVQDTAVNIESIFYDTGFPTETKYDLCQFIAHRKDTFIVLSTFSADDPVLDATGELALATALDTHLKLYPESEYFGTPVTRGMIVGFNGKLLNHSYKKRVPLSAEIIIKASRYMGQGNGKWKSGENFDGAPGSVIQNVSGISVKWVSGQARNRFWDVGLCWAQPYDRLSYFFPAFKTVYDNDTSVLNSFPNVMAVCTLAKVSQAAWREFSGVTSLTKAQLIERVNNFILANVKDRFDGKYVVIPKTTITDMDKKRGYSWTTVVQLWAPNMETVMTTYVQAFRLDDLPSTTNG
jgi:hypothetical protein